MGALLFDQYSLLHLAVGVVAYFWGIPLTSFALLHAFFEVVENTVLGMHIINHYLTIWPGGKSHPDSIINSVGDHLSALAGWLLAYGLDRWARSHHLTDDPLLGLKLVRPDYF